MQKTVDIVVIGAGSGGLTAAVGFAKAGKKVVLIEREHLGGECTNSGCIPSKALLHAAREYSKHKSGSNSEALSYVRQTINSILIEETPEVFETMGIDVVLGDARFISKCAVDVGETQYHYKTAIIATGSNPRMITIDGLDETDTLTNQTIFDLKVIPEKLLVLGAGPIGMELGQAFAMLGSQVTLATIDTEFAHLEDKALRPLITKQFTDLGVTIELNAHIKQVRNNVAFFDRKNDGVVETEFSVPFDKILIAIGRTPNLPTGLDTADIKSTSYGISVDSQHRTSNKYVYAVGDVAQKLKFTHTADDIARQVVTRVVSKGLLRVTNKKAVPKVTYLSPEVAQVGLSWETATTRYKAEQLMRIEVPYAACDRAITDSATDGKLIIIARRLTGTVLGAHIVGARAGEIITLFTLAIDEKISLWKLQKLIVAYPVYSLIVKKAADQFVGRQLTDLKIDIIALIKRNATKVVAAFFWSILLYSFHHYRLQNDLSYQDVLWQLLDFFTSTLWGPIVYMGLYAVRPLILFPATLLTALSGALFGFWWGILYTIIGENASANFAYWIGRFFGNGWRLEDTIIGNWVERLRDNSFEAVLLMRLFYVPFDLTNYGSGVVGAKWRSYFFATLIGIMPGLTTFVALGAAVNLDEFQMNGLSFNAFDPAFLTLSVAIFVVSLLFSRLLKRWRIQS